VTSLATLDVAELVNGTTVSDNGHGRRPLSAQHLAMLRDGSGISDEVIRARGYRTITYHKDLAALGFSDVQRRTPGMLLPLWATDGGQPFAICRPDSPRQVATAPKKDPATGTIPTKRVKHESRNGVVTRIDCPRDLS
jgi:hypothetical protein